MGVAMAQCYWKLCHCPDSQPCAEHTGFFCSTFNGATVDEPGDVNDTVTRDAQIAIVALGEDADKIDRLRGELEAKKSSLEQMRDKIQRGLDNDLSFSERSEVAAEILAARDRLAQLDQEIKQIMADEASLSAKTSMAGGLISTYLIVPYSSPGGYCACYDEKRRQLAAIAAKTNAIRNGELADARALQAYAISQATTFITPIAINLGKIIGALTVYYAIAAYAIFGIKAAVIVLIVGLIVAAIYVFVILLALLLASAKVARARQKIVQLDLQYYRLQNIGSCQRLALPPPGTGAPVLPPSFVDENEWWKKLLPPPGE
jgi:hypothetical protein